MIQKLTAIFALRGLLEIFKLRAVFPASTVPGSRSRASM